MRVLVVEDHAKLALAIAAVLRREGMAADVAFDGNDALAKSAVNRYDVIVLDRDLPGVHDDQVCRELAAGGAGSGILMLTASAMIDDKVEGLSLGADDYLPKPFNIAELVARIRALARRSRPSLPPVLVHGDLRLDPARREATRGGQRLELSPKEFAVLEVLLEAAADRPVRRAVPGRGTGLLAIINILARSWPGTRTSWTHSQVPGPAGNGAVAHQTQIFAASLQASQLNRLLVPPGVAPVPAKRILPIPGKPWRTARTGTSGVVRSWPMRPQAPGIRRRHAGPESRGRPPTGHARGNGRTRDALGASRGPSRVREPRAGG